jgi:membrane protein YqaA with SNARE-associated domain
VIDSSLIPLPVPGTRDLLLWLVAQSGDPWLLAGSAITGSVLGGFSTWQLGQKGGKAALQRHVPSRLLRRVVGWVERHPVLAVFLPALLPPPIPLSPFVLAAGALGVSRNRFLVIFGTARCLRYTFIAWLAASYRREIIVCTRGLCRNGRRCFSSRSVDCSRAASASGFGNFAGFAKSKLECNLRKSQGHLALTEMLRYQPICEDLTLLFRSWWTA